MVLNEFETEDVLKSRFRSRPSRAYLDSDWLDKDHYFEDNAPADTFEDEWKEKCRDLDEIQVNGALNRQWKRGQDEINQMMELCRNVLGKEDL